MSKKVKVAVLMGGKSPEHDISLLSGREVIENLDSKKYENLPIVISKDGKKWEIGDRKKAPLDSPASKINQNHPNLIKIDSSNSPDQFLMCNKIDLVFVAMHGPFGEDGTIQGFLDLVGVRYTGSGVLASALGMDKIYSRKIFTQAGLKTPRCIVLSKKDNPQKVWRKLKVPVFVKPAAQGSSIGISKVHGKGELGKALQNAFLYGDRILVDEYLSGTEVTVGIIGNDNPQALPPVEIVPKNEFFDYESKYNESKCDEICPARISPELTKKAQEAAKIAFASIGCRDFARVDIIIHGQDVYVLEVNTIPGLTSISLFPKAAKAAGYSYSQLLDKMVSLAQAHSLINA